MDFPSSPKQLKECLEAHGMAMPLERDSGTTGWYIHFIQYQVSVPLGINFSGNNSGISFIFKTVVVIVYIIVVKFLKMLW